MTHPENSIFRSHIEIIRIFHALVKEHCMLAAMIKNGQPFSSHLLNVDDDSGHFAIGYSTHKTINTMLLNSPSVEFTATDQQGMYFSFEVTSPEETQVNGQPAIQFALPKILLSHNRREHQRIPVAAELSLRCVADESGFIPFESHITDISHDGMGSILYDADINLEIGTVLKGCRIITPNGDALTTDLELRHVSSESQSDGTLVHRAGFRFVQKAEELTSLIKLFIQDLDKK